MLSLSYTLWTHVLWDSRGLLRAKRGSSRSKPCGVSHILWDHLQAKAACFIIYFLRPHSLWGLRLSRLTSISSK